MNRRISKKFSRILVLLIMLSFLGMLSGCATIPEAIEHSSLQIGTKMSDTIFLDPEYKMTHRKVFIDVTNTSNIRKINTTDFKQKIASALQAKGYQVVLSPSDADYILQVNVLYFDHYRQTGAREGATEGAALGAAGALAATRANDVDDLIVAAVAAGAGYTGGAIVGKMIHIDTFAGVVDMQIKERHEKPVKETVETNASQGSATVIQQKLERESHWMIYRTKIAVTATKTNLKEEEVAKVVENNLADQIAGIF